MLHTKFREIGLPVLEKKIFEGFLPRRLHIKFGFD